MRRTKQPTQNELHITQISTSDNKAQSAIDIINRMRMIVANFCLNDSLISVVCEATEDNQTEDKRTHHFSDGTKLVYQNDEYTAFNAVTN